jgi:hypothetical protein
LRATASRSNATNDAGVAAASFATREAAGCSRSWSASKSSPWLRRDDDLAVEHATLRHTLEQRVMEIREIPIERSKVATLEEE